MKLFFDSIGCKLNQSEIEKLAIQFRSYGHHIVASPAEADYVIVNTCSVTAAADADSRKAIRRAARQGNAKIIATGCYATISPSIFNNLPNVEEVVDNSKKDKIPESLMGDRQEHARPSLPRIPLPGGRKRTRAFIKVQDGCDNLCTYCITRIARGKSRSQPVSVIFNDISSAIDGGVKEVVLTGVNLGSWGRDLGEEESLAVLITNILENFKIPRLRLSSLEPWDIDEGLIQTFRMSGFCHHLHLPLQSGSDKVLRAMGRRSLTSDYVMILEKIRKAIPRVAITTDIIVGFPGESESDFNESLKFIENMEFAGGHVFRYSKRPGTHAEKLLDAPTHTESKNRSRQMRTVIENTRKTYQERFIGERISVLWQTAIEVKGKRVLKGLSDNYIIVEAESNSKTVNQLSDVLIKKYYNDHIFGEIV